MGKRRKSLILSSSCQFLAAATRSCLFAQLTHSLYIQVFSLTMDARQKKFPFDMEKTFFFSFKLFVTFLHEIALQLWEEERNYFVFVWGESYWYERKSVNGGRKKCANSFWPFSIKNKKNKNVVPSAHLCSHRDSDGLIASWKRQQFYSL